MAAEERLVGEHRDRRGAALGVGHARTRPGRSSARISPRHGERRFTSAITRGSGPARDRAREVAQRRRHRLGAARELLGRLAVARRGELRALVVEDLVEDHRPARLARPLLRALRDERGELRARGARVEALARERRGPRARSAAAPATQSTAAAFSSTTSRRGPASPSSTASAIAGVLRGVAAAQRVAGRERNAERLRVDRELAHARRSRAARRASGR